MVDDLKKHEMPEGVLTVSPTLVVNPVSPVMVTVVESDAPSAKFIDAIGLIEKSGRMEERQTLLSVIPNANAV